MATRRLEVELIGDDRSLQRMYARQGRSVGLLEKQFGRSGRAADQFFTRTGAAARTATPYVAAFAGAGLAVAVKEAREANKVGNQTRAVIKSMGGSANVTAREVEDLAEQISVKAGMDDEAIQKGENLLLTFKNLRNEAGEGNKVFDRTTQLAVDMSVALEQDLSSSAIQLGKALNDPAVGLTALRRVGVSFNEQQTEQIKTLFESGEQLKAQKIILRELTKEFGGSAAAQADSFDRIKVVALNYAETVGERVLPTLEDYAERAAAILGDKKLSGEEKAERLAALFEEATLKGIEKLEDAAPMIARTSGRIGLRAVEGFAKAWLESDLLGKLFLGGLLVRTLGGPGAFAALGKFIGTRVGGAMATQIAATTAAGGLFGGRGRRGTRAPTTVAQAPFGGGRPRPAGPGMPMLAGAGPIGAAVAAATIFAPMEQGSRQVHAMSRATAIGEDRLRQFSRAIEENNKLSVKQRKEVLATAKAMGVQGQDLVRLKKHLREAGRDYERVGRDMDRAFETGKISKRLDRFLRKYKLSWRELQGITGASGSRIAQIVSNLADALGASGVNARSIKAAIGTSNALGNMFGGARGGTIPGYSAVDDRLMMVRSGEALLTPEVHQPVVEAALRGWYGFGLEDLFRKTGAGPAPVGMAKGGIAGTPQINAVVHGPRGGMLGVASGAVETMEIVADHWLKKHAGGNLATISNLVVLGRQLQKMGYHVSEHPAFGGVGGGHSPTGYHPKGRAIDVNHDQGNEMQALDRIYGPLKRNPNIVELLWRTSDHYDHLHAAMARGGVAGDFARAVRAHRANRAAATALFMAGFAESGMRDLNYGHSTSEGSLQLLASTARSMGLDPHNEFAVASAFLTRGYWGKGSAIGLSRGNRNPALIAHLVQGNATGTGVYAAQAGRAEAAMRQMGLYFDSNGQLIGAYGMLERRKGPFKRQSHAVNYLRKLGFSKREAQRAAENYVAKHPKQGGPAAGAGGGGGGAGGGGGGAGSPAASAPISLPGLQGLKGLSFEDQLNLLEIAATEAEGTPETADDLAVIAQRIGLLQRRDAQVLRRIKESSARLDAGGTFGLKRKKGESAKAFQKRVRERARQLRDQRSEALGEHAGLVADIASLKQEQTGGDAGGGDSLAENTEAIKALTDELAAVRKSADSVNAIDKQEALRALVDFFNGELGGRIDRIRRTAGAGSAVDY